MASKQEKQVQVIARRDAGKGTVVYFSLPSSGEGVYETKLVNGKATSCTCPARIKCYHQTQLEAMEAAHLARVTIAVGDEKVSAATAMEAVERALAVLRRRQATLAWTLAQQAVKSSQQPLKRVEDATLSSNRGFSFLR